METNQESFSIVFFILFFVGMWLGVTIILSYTSGWASLAKIYRASKSFHGARWTPIHAQLGEAGLLGSFGNSLNIGANAEGLHLSVFILFRVNCPALFIPWEDVSVESKKILGFRYKEFRFQKVIVVLSLILVAGWKWVVSTDYAKDVYASWTDPNYYAPRLQKDWIRREVPRHHSVVIKPIDFAAEIEIRLSGDDSTKVVVREKRVFFGGVKLFGGATNIGFVDVRAAKPESVGKRYYISP